jgi:hypothetical protein
MAPFGVTGAFGFGLKAIARGMHAIPTDGWATSWSARRARGSAAFRGVTRLRSGTELYYSAVLRLWSFVGAGPRPDAAIRAARPSLSVAPRELARRRASMNH